MNRSKGKAQAQHSARKVRGQPATTAENQDILQETAGILHKTEDVIKTRSKEDKDPKRDPTPYYVPDPRARSQSRERERNRRSGSREWYPREQYQQRDNYQSRGYYERPRSRSQDRPRYVDNQQYRRMAADREYQYRRTGTDLDYRDKGYPGYVDHPSYPGYNGRNDDRGSGQRSRPQSQDRQRHLPSRSGHPEDVREKKQPMNAMPVERVPMKQPKQQVNAVAHDDYEYANYASQYDHPDLN